MKFKKYSHLEGRHAFLSASKYSWIRYTEDKLCERFNTYKAAQKGTELHELAKDCICLGVKLPRIKNALNMYVNDGIGFKMTPEQILYYSDNCFGTADTISFRKKMLRIHDLKTGLSLASMDQLMVYTAIFCLEYQVKPSEIDIELRIYQNNEVIIENPHNDDIIYIMDKIITFDKRIDILKLEEGD